MNIKQLLTTQQCPMKGTFIYDLGVSSFGNSKSKHQLTREIFLKDINSLNDLKLVDLNYLNDKFDDFLFCNDREKQYFIKNILGYVDAFSKNLEELKNCKLSQKVQGTLDFYGTPIDISVDMVLEGDTYVDLINLKLTDAKIKKGGRKESTKIEYSIELYLMYLLGEQLYPNKSIRASLAYLKEDIESKNFLATRIRRTDKDLIYFSDTINNLFATNQYDENCDSSNCFMCDYKDICMYSHNLEKLEDNKTSVDLDNSTPKKEISYTKEQEDVINFKSGIGIVNAVAGSGKTATITKRLATLLEDKNIDNNDIIVLSFSDKTIDEFKSKLSKNHNITNFENIFTFNGFGDFILSKHYDMFGYQKKPRLINSVEKMDLIKSIIDSSLELNELNDINDFWDTRNCIIKTVDYSNPFMKIGKNLGLGFQLSKIFDGMKSKGLNYSKEEFINDEITLFEENVDSSNTLSDDTKDFLIDKYEQFLEKIYAMYESYSFSLKKEGLYEYSDQINYLVSSLNNPRLKDEFKYKHIICDEFQDSNNLSMYILRKLTTFKNFESLLVVGDINQSIYGFLGTTPENLLNFQKRFSNKVFKFDLSYTFRVPKVISKCANALMDNSFKVNYNKMVSFKEEEGILSSFEDINILKTFIKDAVNKNKTIGLIARNNQDLNAFTDLLLEENIPYVIKSNLDVLKKDKVKNLLHLSSFFVNNDNKLEYVKYLQVSDYEEFSKNFKTPSFDKYLDNKFNDIYNKIDMKNPVELLEIYFELLSDLSEKDYMIEVFKNHLVSQRFKSIYDLNDYCDKIDLYGLEIKAPENDVDSNVVVTTAHSSKGREFDITIMDTSTFKDVSEEDRRLFYVSMTRSKEELYLISLPRKGVKKKDCLNFLEPIKKALSC